MTTEANQPTDTAMANDLLTDDERAALVDDAVLDADDTDPAAATKDPEDGAEDDGEPKQAKSDEEIEAEAAAAVAALNKTDTTDEAKESETVETTEAVAEDDDDDVIPIPTFRPRAPADAKAQLDKIEADLSALDDKFDEGDLSAKEKRLAERPLVEAREAIKDAIRSDNAALQAQEQAEVRVWQQTVNEFFKENPEMRPPKQGEDNPAQLRKAKAFNEIVVEMGKAAEAKEARGEKVPSDRQILKAAKAEYDATFGTTKAGAPKVVPKTAPKADAKLTAESDAEKAARAKTATTRKAPPPTLRNVPAADANEIGAGDGEFGAIDRLSGEAREIALRQLSEAQVERWLRSA